MFMLHAVCAIYVGEYICDGEVLFRFLLFCEVIVVICKPLVRECESKCHISPATNDHDFVHCKCRRNVTSDPEIHMHKYIYITRMDKHVNLQKNFILFYFCKAL